MPQRLAINSIVHTAFSDYQLIKQIGEGGNGRVFSALDSSDNHVAIKFVPRTDISDSKYKRFKNEVFFCEHARHDNIIRIIDHGYEEFDKGGFSFYVMPQYERTLRHLISDGLTPEKAVEIFVGIMSALHYAHENKVVHRDIKPENILMDKNDKPVICDFGIAHFSEEFLITPVKTKVTERLANFQYAAPEQRKKGVQVGAAADIFAAALILNEMFTHEIPQAEGYAKIADVCPDYAFLDPLFSMMYKQDANERLHPADKVIIELKLLAEINRNEKSRKLLEETVVNMNDPGTFEAKIVDKKYENGEIRFYFDRDLPELWREHLTSGNYSHSAMGGRGPETVSQISPYVYNVLRIPLRSYDSKSTIVSIASYMADWVASTNSWYTSYLRMQAEEERAKRERERLAKIKELDRANSINSLLSNI